VPPVLLEPRAPQRLAAPLGHVFAVLGAHLRGAGVSDGSGGNRHNGGGAAVTADLLAAADSEAKAQRLRCGNRVRERGGHELMHLRGEGGGAG
jgi:hypothetical protein